MQFRAVDEPTGGHVSNFGVVLPAVPQSADHLDVIACLAEQVGIGHGPTAEVPCGLGVRRHLDPHAGAARADVVEGRDGLRGVKGLGMGGDHRRHQTDVTGAGCDPRGDQGGVEAAPHAVGSVVGTQRVLGLQRQTVLEGDEVQQTSFGLGDQVGPVAGRQQVGGPGVGLTPGRGMPSRPVECDGEMKSIGATGHGRSHFRSRSPAQRPRALGAFLRAQCWPRVSAGEEIGAR